MSQNLDYFLTSRPSAVARARPNQIVKFPQKNREKIMLPKNFLTDETLKKKSWVFYLTYKIVTKLNLTYSITVLALSFILKWPILHENETV